MVLVEAVFLIGLLGVVVYAITALPARVQDQRRTPSLSGAWRVAHYDDKDHTRVVLQKVSGDGTHVLDEHLVAKLRTDDPEYDDKFLGAMSIARQRQALFETEEGC